MRTKAEIERMQREYEAQCTKQKREEALRSAEIWAKWLRIGYEADKKWWENYERARAEKARLENHWRMFNARFGASIRPNWWCRILLALGLRK